MLSYSIDEAETMLESKLSGAYQTLGNCEEDLDFLREQITVQNSAHGESCGLTSCADIGSGNGAGV